MVIGSSGEPGGVTDGLGQETMFVIIGIVVVIGAILGGYLMEHGNLRVLIQPAELVIIGGAALGTVLIANPLYILKADHRRGQPRASSAVLKILEIASTWKI